MRPGVGYFYALTSIYMAKPPAGVLGVEQTIRMESFFTPGSLPMSVTILGINGQQLISLPGRITAINRKPAGCRSGCGLATALVSVSWC